MKYCKFCCKKIYFGKIKGFTVALEGEDMKHKCIPDKKYIEKRSLLFNKKYAT